MPLREELFGCVLIGEGCTDRDTRQPDASTHTLAPTNITGGSTIRGHVQEEVGSPEHGDRHSNDAEQCEACAVARSGAAGSVGPWLAGRQ